MSSRLARWNALDYYRDLPKTPSLAEWETMQRPTHWPYVHCSKFSLPEKPALVTAPETDWPSDEEDDSDFIPDSSSDGEGSEDSDFDYIDSISEDESVNAIDQSLEVSTNATRDSIWTEAELSHRIATLEAAEASCASTYDPSEVIFLLTELYNLLIRMGHWPPGSVESGPHAINLSLAESLGYESQIISLMQNLTYLKPGTEGGDKRCLIPESSMADYRSDDALNEGRCPLVPHGNEHPLLDPWILPLAFPRWYGYVVYLDTRLGVIRAYEPSYSPPKDTIEWLRDPPPQDEEEQGLLIHEYRRAPLVSAGEYLRGLIEAYKTLTRLPVIRADQNDPEKEYRTHDSKHDAIFQEIKDKQKALLELYEECGWPDNWRREEFLEKWMAREGVIERQIRQAKMS